MQGRCDSRALDVSRDLRWALHCADIDLRRKSAPTTPLSLPSTIACFDVDFDAVRLPGCDA
jgi:hypothetical protein